MSQSGSDGEAAAAAKKSNADDTAGSSDGCDAISKGVVDPSEQPAPDVVDPSEDLMRHKEYIDTPAEEPQGKKLFIGGISWRSDEGKA